MEPVGEEQYCMVGDGVVCSDKVRARNRESSNHLITAELINKCHNWFYEIF
jgi:hypothetical protein